MLQRYRDCELSRLSRLQQALPNIPAGLSTLGVWSKPPLLYASPCSIFWYFDLQCIGRKYRGAVVGFCRQNQASSARPSTKTGPEVSRGVWQAPHGRWAAPHLWRLPGESRRKPRAVFRLGLKSSGGVDAPFAAGEQWY